MDFRSLNRMNDKQTDAINKLMESRTIKIKQNQQQYYAKNAEAIIYRQMIYYQQKREAYLAYMREYNRSYWLRTKGTRIKTKKEDKIDMDPVKPDIPEEKIDKKLYIEPLPDLKEPKEIISKYPSKIKRKVALLYEKGLFEMSFD